MASEHESDQEHVALSSEPSDLLRVDDRLVVLERDAKTYSRHIGQLEGAVFNQMIAVTLLEVAFALFLACMVWVEYRRKTEEVRRGADQN
jgi:hypothetical protein